MKFKNIKEKIKNVNLKNKNLIYSILISSGISSMFAFSMSKDIEKLNDEVADLTEKVNSINEELEQIETRLEIVEEQTEELNSDKVEENVEQEIGKADQIITEYFETTLTDVIKTSERENVEIYRESIIQAVSYLSDFIFFDYELLGIKFTDITTETKANAIVTYVEIDKKVEQMYPNYKNELGDKSDIIEQFFKELYEYNRQEQIVDYIESEDKATYSVKDITKVKVFPN